MGGGVGGGSSNAASALVALNYYGKPIYLLMNWQKLGLTLGADVPNSLYMDTLLFAERCRGKKSLIVNLLKNGLLY